MIPSNIVSFGATSQMRPERTPDRDKQARRPCKFLSLKQSLDMTYGIMRCSTQNFHPTIIRRVSILRSNSFSRSDELLYGQAAGGPIVGCKTLHHSDSLCVMPATDEVPRRLLESENEESKRPEYESECTESEEKVSPTHILGPGARSRCRALWT